MLVSHHEIQGRYHTSSTARAANLEPALVENMQLERCKYLKACTSHG